MQDKAAGRLWPVMRGRYGFFRMYEEARNRLEKVEDQEMLDNSLGLLFSHLECLPGGKKESVWEIEDQAVVLLGNPRYYKLDQIGHGRTKTRRPPTLTSKGEIEKGMLELEGMNETIVKQVLAQNKYMEKIQSKRSGKSRNYRKPPVKGGKKRDEEREGKESSEEQDST